MYQSINSIKYNRFLCFLAEVSWVCHKRSCYTVKTTTIASSKSQAIEHCNDINNTHLVALETAEENQFIWDLIRIPGNRKQTRNYVAKKNELK